MWEGEAYNQMTDIGFIPPEAINKNGTQHHLLYTWRTEGLVEQRLSDPDVSPIILVQIIIPTCSQHKAENKL